MRDLRRARALTLALVALALASPACGGQLAGDTAEDTIRVGFVPKSLNQEFWVNTKKGAEAAAGGTSR